MYVKFFVLFVISMQMVFITGSKPKKTCEKQRNSFAEKNMEFMRCSMQHTLPVTYCTDCIESYVFQLEAFQKFVTTHDAHSDTETCGMKYLKRDRLDILGNGFQSAKDLWNRGSCSKCFDCDPENLPPNANVTEVCNKTQDLIQFTDIVNVTQDCIARSFNEAKNACKLCLDSYNKQIGFYNHLKTISDQICFNIEDMMNKTQWTWINQLSCIPNTPAAAGWSILTLLSILIIIGAVSTIGFFAYTKFIKQRNYFSTESTDRSNLSDSSNTFGDS